jgi:hypothetical protein
MVADLDTLPWESFLPTEEEMLVVKHNLTVLVCCILTKYFPCLASFSGVVPAHILHRYSAQTAEKSEVDVIDAGLLLAIPGELITTGCHNTIVWTSTSLDTPASYLKHVRAPCFIFHEDVW